MNLLTLFQWLSHSSLGLYMQKSVWTFAIVETVHLVALASLGGSVLTIELTTLGLIRKTPAREIASGLRPIVLTSLAVMVATGILMLSDEALKCYYSPAFRAKMLALGIAVLIFFPLRAIQIRTTRDHSPWWLKTGAALSLLSWLSVGLAGRAIGFL